MIYTCEFVPWQGGVATYNYELANGLQELGEDVLLLAPRYAIKDEELDANMHYKVIRAPFPIRSILKIRKNIFEMARDLCSGLLSAYYFIRIQKYYKADRILITNALAHEIGAIARIFYPFEFILTVHGTEIYTHFGGNKIEKILKKRFMKWFFSKANKIICVSKSTKNLLEDNVKGMRNKTFLVYYGINVKKFDRHIKSEILKQFKLFGSKIILTIARLSPGKGQDVVIKALPKVLEIIPEAKYIIVGDGVERQNLEKLVDKMGVRESVLFVGPIENENLGYFYDACDVFVMVSRRGKKESFGIVYLEAWAHEKPVVGGDVGGVNEVIEHGKTGILVNPTDDEAVSEAICYLLKNQKIAAIMGKAGRKNVEERFSRKSMAEKTQELL